MKRGFFVGFVLAASALPAVGCGDDDSGDDGGTGGTGGGMNVECTPGGGGACQNETDCPKVESGEARMDSQTCGLRCLENADPGMCTVGCIVQEAAVTQACAICYATLAGCAADNCLAQCSADAASAECNQCQIDSGCRSAFDDCSGLTTVPP
ncbi:MAG TPA: hypothetical protein VMS65_03180 [Polyangiaceae bacterium]|nr:hypothetical protein [Polyangiaceae bacterium]